MKYIYSSKYRNIGDRLEENQNRTNSRTSKTGSDYSSHNKTVSREKTPLSRLAEKSSSHLTSSPLINIDPITSGNQSVPTSITDNTDISKSDTKLDFINGTEDDQLEYLLLSQEEYLEHHSEITQCKFSTSSGYLIASSDMEGIIKIWSAGPPGPPHTLATFISNSSVTSLEWMPHSDNNFIYGTSSGNIRICDQSQRKTTTDINANVDQYSAPSNDNSLGIAQIALNTSGTTLAASVCCQNNIRMENSSLYDMNIKDGSLVLYDIRTSTRLDEYDFSKSLLRASNMNSNFANVVTSLAFNHNSQILTTGSSDGKVRIFDLRKGGDCISSWMVGSSDTKLSPIKTIQPSCDDTSIFTLSEDGYFSKWSIVQTSQKLFGAKIQDPYFSPGIQLHTFEYHLNFILNTPSNRVINIRSILLIAF